MVRLGHTCSEFTVKMLKACAKMNVYYVIQNPSASRLFTWKPLAQLLTQHGAEECVLDQCRFGMPYRKSTRLVGTLPNMSLIDVVFALFRTNGLMAWWC